MNNQPVKHIYSILCSTHITFLKCSREICTLYKVLNRKQMQLDNGARREWCRSVENTEISNKDVSKQISRNDLLF